MAKTSLIVKSKKEPKFSTRRYNRCRICGRPRVCFRKLASEGQIPGVTKSSW